MLVAETRMPLRRFPVVVFRTGYGHSTSAASWSPATSRLKQ